MLAGTTVTYGPVTLSNVVTRQFRQEPVYDRGEQSVMYHRFLVAVTGYCHGDPQPQQSGNQGPYTLPADTAGQSAALSHQKIRHALLHPRQPFAINVGVSGGNQATLLSAIPAAYVNPNPPPSTTEISKVDVNNGPRCKDFQISQIVANEIFRVDAEFEICVVECNEAGACSNNSGILSNVWSCTDDIDQNFKTRRTWSGQLQTVTTLLNPHAFRNFVFPPLSPGMRRDSMQFVAGDDGKTLAYTIVDQEVHFMPPRPATSWSVNHTETVSREGAIGCFVDVEVRLAGPRNADKRQLISIAAAIVEAKISAGRDPKTRIINRWSITDTVGDNESTISAVCNARRVLELDNAQVIAGIPINQIRPVDQNDFAQIAGIVGQYDPQAPPGARTGETARAAGPIGMAAAFSVYLQSPCSTQHAIYTEPLEPEPPPAPGGASPNLEVYTTAEIVGDQSTQWLSEESQEGVYTWYQVESSYTRQGLRAHCPIAKGSLLGYQNPGYAAYIPTSVVVALGHNLVKRRIRYKAERSGNPPKFPAPRNQFEEAGVTYTLLDTVIMAAVPERGPDGMLVYREERDYIYAADRDPFVEGENIAVRIGTNYDESSPNFLRSMGADEWNRQP